MFFCAKGVIKINFVSLHYKSRIIMRVEIDEREIVDAVAEGMDAFVRLFYNRTMEAIGGELNASSMAKLNADQITLLAYVTFCDEVMDGGHVQLIHNGYGPFIFLNPFAKAMRLWGAKDFCNLVYKGRKLFEKYGTEIAEDCDDETFMALFEKYPEFDDLDDEFIEMEEEVTEMVARYIDEHLSGFADVRKTGQ